jgi:peptidyl-prolyl cis-trans isomerase A (cyclophilin A)
VSATLLRVKRTLLAAILAAAIVAGAAAASGPSLLHPASLDAKAPAVYRVRFTTTKGPFVVTVHRTWAPRGADRFYNLVHAGFYNGQRLFRVIPGFVVQWGISGTPKIARAWQNATIRDDPVRHSNKRGTIVFADAGPNTRTTQVFVNLGQNAQLDGDGFAPFGTVTSGLATLQHLYHGYGEAPSDAQAQLTQQGEAFVKKHFPKLDRILKTRLLG